MSEPGGTVGSLTDGRDGSPTDVPWWDMVDDHGDIDHDRVPRPRYGPFREILVWLLVVGAVAVLARQLAIWGHYGAFHYGVMAMTLWLATMVALAAMSRPWVTDEEQDEWLAGQRVAVVITHYNEDPDLLVRCVRSVVAQTRRPDVVWVIDDGSNDADAHDAVVRWAQDQSVPIEAHRLETNVGKRHAQAHAFGRDRADILVAVDSDSLLDPYAIEEIVKPLADPGNHVVSGSIVGLNWRRNLLTRVVDIELVSSFVVGRSALNAFRGMNVTCGVLAAYRGWVVRRYLRAYVNQRFLGSVVRAGDDRDLTQYCLLEGRGVHQESAVAYTALPERLGHLLRQRFRWGSSLYRGIVWSVVHLPFTHPAFWLIVFEGVVTVCAAAAWSWLLVWEPIVNHSVHLGYMAYLLVLSVLQSARYLVAFRRNQTSRQRWANMALAPLVAVLYVTLLLPVLFVSVLGVRERTWWTRRRVEVVLDLRDLPEEHADRDEVALVG